MPHCTRKDTCIPGIHTCMLAVSVFLTMFTGGHQGKLEQYSFSLFVREDAVTGTLVGEVKGEKFNPPFARWISQATDNITLNSFHVDLITGKIFTKEKLDREQQDRHAIIISTSFSSPKLLIIDVRILDVNDFTPIFLNSFVNVSVPESAPKYHKIPLGSVRDEDAGENTTQKVEIVSGNDDGDFGLEIINSSSMDKMLDLVVSFQLDYERTRVYNFVIRATDGGGRFSEMSVVINVLDQNDNEPIFNMSKYSARVPENSPVGATVLQVWATDIDSGENSLITYSIDPRSDPEEVFTISSATGIIRVNKPLDYETRDRFSLTLQARDSGISPQMGTSALDIIVENVNEQPANISLQFQASFSSGQLPENVLVGTLIAIVAVNGTTSFLNSGVEVFLYNSKGYFTLKKHDFLGLYVSSELDRERVGDFEMTLQVLGKGKPPMRANKIFRVIVSDINDNAPVFDQSEYVTDVEETAEVGTEVARVSAADADMGANADITYRIDNGSQNMGWFVVDSSTGIVTTTSTLDCNINPHPVLVIVATDGGDPPQVSSAQVTINIRNADNKAPEFETSFYSIKVAENRRLGECIMMVSATDPECGTNSPVIYRMVQTLAPPKEFRVDPTSGAICIQSELDFEVTKSYQFQVEAVDTDGLIARAVVQIEITDVNDNHPRFEPKEYPINVLAGVEHGHLVTVQSRDRDSVHFGTVSYTITEGNEKGYFDINTGTGSISMKKALPEHEGIFNLRILATDGGGMTSPELALVTVSVISGLVHPPIFTPTIYNFTINEDAALGHVVGQVQASLDDTGSNMEIIYSSLFQTEDWFRIDSHTGYIYTNHKLDRELYPFVVLSIQAQASFPPVYTIAQINVTILDVNDNRPVFPDTAMLELDVWEDEQVGTALYIARASDPDVGDNGTITYRFHNQHRNTFSIDAHTGEITLVRPLDFERIQEYLLVVVAEDQGNPVILSSNMTLTVKVKDVNDNAPKFSQILYEFYVPENAEAGYPVGTVSADDADSNHNKRLSFHLMNNVHDSVFGISSIDGALWTRVSLDREFHEIYELIVQAVDHGSSTQLSSSVLIRIIVTDINDNQPVFSREEYQFYIMENLQINSLVGNVKAVDLDTGISGQVQYFFPRPQNIFSINSQNGEIRTQTSLDRELIEEHFVTVYASDKGDIPMTAVVNVRIVVLDDNDNEPTFLKTIPFEVNISENRERGTEVITLTAVDPDEGVNAVITYFFDKEQSESSALTNFQINPRSGKITTKEVLNYEMKSEYHLIVIAQDSGEVFRQTSQSMTISVLDTNDQAFLHHTHFINFDCPENTKIGTVIGQIKAAGIFDSEDEELTYYLVGGNVFSTFSVGDTSGIIYIVGEIDYEKSPSHSLSIQVVDSSSTQSKTINIGVTINILDVNDNAPVFDQDPVIIRSVTENVPYYHIIHKFSATDSDSGINGTVHYSIETSCGDEEAHTSYLSVDAESGELLVSRSIDYEQIDQICIIVKAEDACQVLDQVRYSLATIIIFVADINDNAPVFKSANSLTVSEDEVAGSILLMVVALDADSNIDGSGNNVVTYHIVDGNDDGKFVLEADTGYLSLRSSLDYETRTHYTLNISAEDEGSPKLVAYQHLQIAVTDVNDNIPVFDEPVYRATVSENINTQMSVIQVQARDADSGKNGQLTYFIPSGIADDKFVVDSKTGVVVSKVQLDREVKNAYTLTVFVKDGAHPVFFSSCNIHITVTDQNDNPPVFKHQLYTVQIPENRAHNSVLTLVASDKDTGDNARMTYSITGGNDGNFKIDPWQGILSTSPLDRELISIYNLTITARDNGDVPQTATTYVVVTVLDGNDNSPVFEEMAYTTSIPEDTLEGSLILTVTAKDTDQGQNGHVSYSLDSEVDAPFEVNSSTGEIYTCGTFDRERISSYSLVIVASDGGVFGPRNSTVRFIVTITDVNDNPPIFAVVPYAVSLNLLTPPKAYILTVTAVDPDLGYNGLVQYSFQEDVGSAEMLEGFYIDSTSGEIYTRNLLFRASGRYSLLVVATDMATSPGAQLSSTGIIEITVGSGEGIQFQFTSSEYNVEIPEHYMGGNSFINVSATFDQVYQQSQSTFYNFAGGNEKGIFNIDNKSGQISVEDASLLDYETDQQIILIVRATSGKHRAYANVHINLTDINDNTPKFSQAKYVSAIWENNRPETFVAQVYARDADSGSNGELAYTIIGGNGDNVFRISRDDIGIVVTNSEEAPLDRETKPDGYRITIEARDFGNPSRSSTCVVIISINDENDTPPFFPEIRVKNISESSDVGYVVTMTTANDVDLNSNLVYDFTADGNLDNTFSLDHSTGRLTLARRLDYEKKSQYSVGIQVTDGKPDHIRSTWLDVYVNDENDNAPVFSQPSYQVTLPEQTGPQQAVITVTATDVDSGFNAQVTYSLAPTSDESFIINAHTGTIYTSKMVVLTSDESIIQLVVIATDNGTVLQSSMTVVSVYITDINKHTPRFLEVVKYVGHIIESAQRGHPVLQVSAVDEDNIFHGSNISYSLIGLGSNLFFIHPRSGHIFWNCGPDAVIQKQYDLTALASDRGVPPKNSSIPVTFLVDDFSNKTSVFLEEKYSIILEENLEQLQVFLSLNSSSVIYGINADVKFLILSGNMDNIFLNSGNEGRLMISEGMRLNYEAHPAYRLIIKPYGCSDCPLVSQHLSIFITVDINVTDVNEFRPRFPVKHFMNVVEENAEIGTVVFRAHANDDDGGEMGVVTYGLMTELDYQKFAVDAITGEVTTKFVFDYEADRVTHLYNLVIIATDKGQNYDMTDVSIQVVDVDEFDPLLTESQYIFHVAGSAKAGDFVGQVSATDDDGGDAGKVIYSFLEMSDYFTIDPSNGNITVATTLHEEPTVLRYSNENRKKRALMVGRIDLTILVSSGKKTSRQAMATCTFSINRTCSGCEAPYEEIHYTTDVDGGILAGIIIACILIIVLTIFGILFLVCKHKRSAKTVGSYMSDSVLEFEPPIQHSHSRTVYADHVRIGGPLSSNNVISDILDQSPKSASSGWDPDVFEVDEDEDDGRTNTNYLLHSTNGFFQKEKLASGTQYDQNESLPEQAVQIHQKYLSNLGINFSNMEKNKHVLYNNIYENNPSKTNRRLCEPFEKVHQFCNKSSDETDEEMESMMYMQMGNEVATLESRTQGTYFHDANIQNFRGHNNEFINDSEIWENLINWSPQYQPLAEVFLEIAKFKDDKVPVNIHPKYHVHPEPRQAQFIEVSTEILKNNPVMSSPYSFLGDQNSDSTEYIPYSSPSHIRDIPHTHSSPSHVRLIPHSSPSHISAEIRHTRLHEPPDCTHSNYHIIPYHMQEEEDDYNVPDSHTCHPVHFPPHSLQHATTFSPHCCPSACTSQQPQCQQCHNTPTDIHLYHHHHHPHLLQHQQQSASPCFNQHLTQTPTEQNTHCGYPCPGYKSSTPTSAIITPSLITSISSPIPRPSPSPAVVSSHHTSHGKSNNRHKSTYHSSNIQSPSYSTDKEFIV